MMLKFGFSGASIEQSLLPLSGRLSSVNQMCLKISVSTLINLGIWTAEAVVLMLWQQQRPSVMAIKSIEFIVDL